MASSRSNPFDSIVDTDQSDDPTLCDEFTTNEFPVPTDQDALTLPETLENGHQ